MGVPRNYEVAPQNKIAEIHPGQKKPAASVLTTAPGFSNDTISINNGPLRRGVVPLEWLDLKALTQYVSVSRRTLTEWLLREENPLPAFRVGGKMYVRRADFDRWMESHPVEGPVNLGKIVDDVMADLQESE
jgi:excisionase family DNA binding protein